MRKNILKYSLPLLLIPFFVVSCNEDEFLDLQNDNELVAETFYTKTANFNFALNGAYSALKSLDLFGQAFYIQSLLSLAHDADYWNAQCRNEVTSGDEWVYVAWRGFYRVVSRANDVLDNAPIYLAEQNPNAADQEEIHKITGQAHFLRALAYFHLVRLWGESSYADDKTRLAIPLHLKVPGTREEMMKARATVGEVYDQIILDLKKAEELLPLTWPADDIARVNKMAVKAYLGKVHLYMGQLPQAKSYFEEVIQSNRYGLVSFSEYDDIFQGKLEFSKESIFELNYAIDLQQNIWENGLGSGIALVISTPGRGWSNCTPHGVNITRFGTDPRLKICTYAPEDKAANLNGVQVPAGKSEFNLTGHSFRKYNPANYSVYSTNRNSGVNFVMFRYSDLLLMYAELLNATGNDAQAMEMTNMVRRRAFNKAVNAPAPDVDLMGIGNTVLRDAIREERFKELFAEGHRWYDITRWKIVETEVNKYNAMRVTQGQIVYHDKDYYYPVPLQEIDNNANMVPSRGYE